MARVGSTLGVILCLVSGSAPLLRAQEKPINQQIAEAVMALPEADRAGATVLGYRGDALPEVIRAGTNSYVCLADTPGNDNFQVSCYHESLAAFMARGRELRAQGMGTMQLRQTRGQEVEAGSLSMPQQAALITLRGRIPAGKTVPDSLSVLRVLYVPYASVESTGFPDRGGTGQPWLMDGGQHRAHIMMPGEVIPFGMPERQDPHDGTRV